MNHQFIVFQLPKLEGDKSINQSQYITNTQRSIQDYNFKIDQLVVFISISLKIKSKPDSLSISKTAFLMTIKTELLLMNIKHLYNIQGLQTVPDSSTWLPALFNLHPSSSQTHTLSTSLSSIYFLQNGRYWIGNRIRHIVKEFFKLNLNFYIWNPLLETAFYIRTLTYEDLFPGARIWNRPSCIVNLKKW